MEGLREYFPQCFSHEGKFDIDKFREAIESQVDVTRVCKKDCFFLTQELLKILEKKGFEWKITSSSYRIKVRRRKEDPAHPNNFSKTNPLIVELKIYGDIDAHNKDEFLVDIHKRAGSVMEFLEFSSSFVSAIQQEGLVVFK